MRYDNTDEVTTEQVSIGLSSHRAGPFPIDVALGGTSRVISVDEARQLRDGLNRFIRLASTAQ